MNSENEYAEYCDGCGDEIAPAEVEYDTDGTPFCVPCWEIAMAAPSP